MVARRPLVLNSGLIAELADGDSALAGYSTTQIIAGSGLSGGGYVSDNPQVDISLAPNPSGLIFVGDAIGNDGVAAVTADAALASGLAAVSLSNAALASGNAALSTAVTAQASGNAAIATALLVNPNGPVQTFTAASDITEGTAVALNDAGEIEYIRPTSINVKTDIKSLSSIPSIFYGVGNVITPRIWYIEEKDIYVVAFCNVSGYPSTIVGVRQGDQIIWGISVVHRSTNLSYPGSVVYHPPTDSFLLNWTSNLYLARLRGTLNTQYMDTEGSELTFLANGGTTSYPNIYYHKPTQEFVAAYQNGSVNKSQIQRISVEKYSNTLLVGNPVNITVGAGYTPDIAVSQTTNDFVAVTGDSVPVSGVMMRGTIDTVGSGVSLYPKTYFNPTGNAYFNSVVYEPSIDKYLVNFYRTTDGKNYGFTAEISGNYFVPVHEPVLRSPYIVNVSYQYNTVYNAYDKVLYTSFCQSSGPIVFISSVLSGNYMVPAGSGRFTDSVNSLVGSITLDTRLNQIAGGWREYFSYGGLTYRGHTQFADSTLEYDYAPKANSYNNVLGIATETVASGSTCRVALPGGVYTASSASFETGAFYYCHAPQSGALTTLPHTPVNWSGQAGWQPLARAISPSGVLVLNTI